MRAMVTTGMMSLVLMVGLFAPVNSQASPERPLAVVDSQRIADEYEAAKDAQAQYEKFLHELEAEITDREKVLTSMNEEIESQKLLLGAEALATKVQAFEKKRAEYFQFREGIDAKAEAEYKTRITPILDQVKTIVERIGKEKGFGLIVDSASLSVLFIDPDYDLTNDVLASLARGDN